MVPFDMADTAVRATLENRNPKYANSLDPLTPIYRHGLIPVGICALLSLLSVTVLLVFITHRMLSWRRHYREYVGYNQYIILIYNLLLADLQQCIAFVISFHWLRIDKIIAPTAPCFIQGWFLNVGDVASAFFVLAIGIHTWLGVVRGIRLSYRWFVTSIVLLWVASVVITVVGPLMYKNDFFTRAGGWCWISDEYQLERLWLHYFWVFVVEFGTIGLYGHLFFNLKGRIRSVLHNDIAKLTRATKFMIMYPAVYVILTLPIAVGRMVAMTGQKIPEEFFIVAGAMLTSCGWIDAVLYTLTRRVFVSNELSDHRTHSGRITASVNATRPGDDFGMSTIDIDMRGNARTVTIVGGSQRMPRIVDRGRSHTREKHKFPEPLREHSPSGSQDSIIKNDKQCIGVVTETDIQIEDIRRDSMRRDSDSISGNAR